MIATRRVCLRSACHTLRFEKLARRHRPDQTVISTPVLNRVVLQSPVVGRFFNRAGWDSLSIARTDCAAASNKCFGGQKIIACQCGSRRQDQMVTEFLFPKRMHLRRPKDFERVYGAGVRAGDAHLLIFVAPNKLGETRLGLSVSKKHGSAVHRNLKRRRLKEVFRLLQHEIPKGLDLIIVPRQRDDSSLSDFQESMRALVMRLSRRISRGSQPSQEDGGQ